MGGVQGVHGDDALWWQEKQWQRWPVLEVVAHVQS